MSGVLSDRLQRYLAGRCSGATISDLQFIVSGWESDVFSFTLHPSDGPPRSLVLRLCSGQGAGLKLVREAQGLRQLLQAGYPVPAILLHEADAAFLGKPFSVMERLDGRPLWPVLAEAAPPRAGNLLDRFGGLLARLHQLDWRPFAEQAALYEADPSAILDELFASSRWLYRQFELPGFLAVVDWLQARAPDVAVHPAVVHQDFHANNVFLCDDDRLSVIDWTQVGVSDYRIDLGWTLIIMGDYGRPEWGERILRAYSHAAGGQPDGLEYFDVIACAKLLASRVICLKAGPEHLGLHPDAADSTRTEAPILRELSQRVRDITGITIPEVETALTQIG